MTIAWKATYNTGNRNIDLQHQELVEMINELDDLLARDASQERLQSLFKSLNQYVVFHFGYEEILMGKGLITPEFRAGHQQEHAAFATRVQAQADAAFANGGAVDRALVVELVEFLKSWLISHILGTDKLLAKMLAAGGTSAP